MTQTHEPKTLTPTTKEEQSITLEQRLAAVTIAELFAYSTSVVNCVKAVTYALTTHYNGESIDVKRVLGYLAGAGIGYAVGRAVHRYNLKNDVNRQK